ncbi:MAG: hypothetical protein ACD_20C00346G0010 [uncultured bacterium]|nr:MAG: hypothetical protein ACD_20C00346G0010 [uncultured bacterium]HBH18442.1 hypothetical protein [Cyanobacteria bacterium UBA9579]
MNKSRKIILISLFPALITLVVIVYFIMPAVANMNQLKDDLKVEKQAYSDTQAQVESLRNNKKLLKEVQELKDKLAGFEIKVPSEDDLAILLVDMGKFSKSFNVSVFSVGTGAEKVIKIEDPNEPKETKKKSTRRKAKETEAEVAPITLSTIPVQIKVIGYYPDVMNFINALENYQRRITIDSISIMNCGKETIRPKVEVQISSAVYKLTENITENNSDEPKKEDKL